MIDEYLSVFPSVAFCGAPKPSRLVMVIAPLTMVPLIDPAERTGYFTTLNEPLSRWYEYPFLHTSAPATKPTCEYNSISGTARPACTRVTHCTYTIPWFRTHGLLPLNSPHRTAVPGTFRGRTPFNHTTAAQNRTNRTNVSVCPMEANNTNTSNLRLGDSPTTHMYCPSGYSSRDLSGSQPWFPGLYTNPVNPHIRLPWFVFYTSLVRSSRFPPAAGRFAGYLIRLFSSSGAPIDACEAAIG